MSHYIPENRFFIDDSLPDQSCVVKEVFRLYRIQSWEVVFRVDKILSEEFTQIVEIQWSDVLETFCSALVIRDFI